jgi:hypothetical protein
MKKWSPSDRRRDAFRSATRRVEWLNGKIDEKRNAGLRCSFLEEERDGLEWLMGEYKRLTGWSPKRVEPRQLVMQEV